MRDNQRSAKRDRGMTLPELLVSITVLGLIVTVLATSITVTLRQTDNTEGRLNVARSEQTVGSWIPADLASASTVVTDPSAGPCGGSCPAGITEGGSNTMLLSWSKQRPVSGSMVDVDTAVSYRYVQDDTGEWLLRRIECITVDGGAPTCSDYIVLHDLQAPPGEFIAGVTSPDWVIIVSEPLKACAVDELDTCDDELADANSDFVKDAQRVVVTVNGGGDGSGNGGGINQISITAGGTRRSTIDATSITGTPTFTEARSRCGGPIAIIVDSSGSIGNTNMATVKNAVKGFIETFAGTPTSIMVVDFDSSSRVVGTSAWTRYFDMTDEAEVSALLTEVNKSSVLTAGGGTNWEDGWYRTFYKADGTLQDVLPERVVFFTDGIPTYDRQNQKADTASLEPPAILPGWPTANGSDYNQTSFNRTNYIASRFRSSVDLIGVGVGGITTTNVQWVQSQGRGYHMQWERGFHQYERGYRWEWIVTRPAKGKKKERGYWSKEYGAQPYYDGWESTSGGDYNANNVNSGQSDGYRVGAKQYSSPYEDWEPSSAPSNSNASGYRNSRVYTEPYTDYETQSTTSTTGNTVLARLIAGNDFGVPINGDYSNAAEADMYILSSWSDLVDALQQVALAECGGTLTLQTRVNGGPASDPFTYQNTEVRNSGGVDMNVEPTVVTTSSRFPTGTFDLPIPSGSSVSVDIEPQNLSDLVGYNFGSWSCKSGATSKTITQTLIPGSTYKTLTVGVSANEAVSCVMNVTA